MARLIPLLLLTLALTLPAAGRELISDAPVSGEIELAAGEVAVVRES